MTLFGTRLNSYVMEKNPLFAALKELKTLLFSNKPFAGPCLYRKLSFDTLTFRYSAKAAFFQSKTAYDDFTSLNIEYVRDLQRHIYLYQDKNKRAVVGFIKEVLTFDSADREWDSYRGLYIVKEGSTFQGFLVAGGYKIASVSEYKDIKADDDFTAYWLSKHFDL